MLAFLGDIHGESRALNNALRIASMYRAKALVQVGDFGWVPGHDQTFQSVLAKYELPVYWIDGNHDHHPVLQQLESITEVMPNCYYVPRGTQLHLDERNIQFCGGAGSIDYRMRLKYALPWHPEEQITFGNLAPLFAAAPPDLLVTHTPPQNIIDRHFDPEGHTNFGWKRGEWRDKSAELIQTLWEHHSRPQLVCGHMHRSIDDPEGVRILDISEVALWRRSGTWVSNYEINAHVNQ